MWLKVLLAGVSPVFPSASATWPLQSASAWTGICWAWTGSPAPAAAGWWTRCGASGTSPAGWTDGPLQDTGHAWCCFFRSRKYINIYCTCSFDIIWKYLPIKFSTYPSWSTLIYLTPRTWEVQRVFRVWDRRTYVHTLQLSLTIMALLEFIVDGGEQGRSGCGGHKSRGMPLT